MNLLPDWLRQALSDGAPENPQVSMSRLIAFLTVLVCVVLPGVLWFWLSGLNSALLDIPGGLIGFMSAASAISLAMFSANKRAE